MTDVQKAEAAKKYKEGLSLRQIAAVMSLSHTVIRDGIRETGTKLRNQGLPTKSKYKTMKKRVEVIRDMRMAGARTQDICNEVGMTRQGIIYVMKREGLLK